MQKVLKLVERALNVLPLYGWVFSGLAGMCLVLYLLTKDPSYLLNFRLALFVPAGVGIVLVIWDSIPGLVILPRDKVFMKGLLLVLVSVAPWLLSFLMWGL